MMSAIVIADVRKKSKRTARGTMVIADVKVGMPITSIWRFGVMDMTYKKEINLG